MADQEKAAEEVSFIGGIVQEIVGSPLNLVLVAIITFLVYKIFKRDSPRPAPPREPELPKLRRDFTVAELKAYDGNQPDGRVLVAVNGTVYDVTRGKRFYGPGESKAWCNGAAPPFRMTWCLLISCIDAFFIFYCQFYCSSSSCYFPLHGREVQFRLHNFPYYRFRFSQLVYVHEPLFWC